MTKVPVVLLSNSNGNGPEVVMLILSRLKKVCPPNGEEGAVPPVEADVPIHPQQAGMTGPKFRLQ